MIIGLDAAAGRSAGDEDHLGWRLTFDREWLVTHDSEKGYSFVYQQRRVVAAKLDDRRQHGAHGRARRSGRAGPGSIGRARVPGPPSSRAAVSLPAGANPLRFVRVIAALFRHTGGDMALLRGISTLIATGAFDQVVPTIPSQELAAQLPQARLARFADAGHDINVQHADELNRLIREHVAAAQR